MLTVVNDMIADIEANKNLSPIVLAREKTPHFTCFYITILLQSAQNSKTKCSTLFYWENT